MPKTTRRASGTLVRFALLLGALATVAVVMAGAVRFSLTDRGAASETTALTATIVLLLLTVGMALTSSRRVRDDLNEYRRAHEGAGAVAGSLVRGSALTGMAVRGMARGSTDLIDQLAPLLTAVFGLAAVGWAVEVPAIPAGAVWVGAPALGLLAGYTVAARVAAWSGQHLRIRNARGVGALIPAVLFGALLAAGMYLLGSGFGQVKWPTVLSSGVLGASVGALGIGTRTARAAERRREAVRGSVAAALSVPESALDSEGDIRWNVGRDGAISVQPGPAAVAKASGDLAGLEVRVASVMPSHEVDRAASAPGFGIRMVPVTVETLESRRLARETEGLATAIVRIEDAEGEPVDREIWSLAALVSPAHAGRVETVARQRGLSLLRWEPLDRRAVVGRISPTASEVRLRLAEVLKADPWSLDVAVLGTADREVDRVTVTLAPWPTGDSRSKTIREAILRLPGGNPGWAVTDDLTTNCVVLEWRKRPQLPGTVPLSDLLPATFDPAGWAKLSLGVGADGKQVGLDLTAGPHALVAGPTGSGKTVGLLTLVAGALARGHALVVIDPTKAGLDFTAIRPWCTAWADDYESARAAIERVYAEVARRKAVLKAEQEVKWSDLSPEVRRREGITPLTVLLDEYGSLALDATVPKGLDKQDALVIEATELNAQKAVLKELVGRIAREARFVGIHLEIALQRPDVSVMGSGELRSNLTSAVQLAPPGKGVSPDAMRMVFNADVVESAAEQIALLDDGKSLGLGVVAAEGGSARGVRVGYAPMRSIPALLDGIGVPRVAEPWDLTGASAQRSRAPREGEILEPVRAPKAESLPDIVEEVEDVSLDDLGLDFSLDEEPATEAPAPEPERAESEPDEDDDNLVDVDDFIQLRPVRKPKPKAATKPALDDPWGLVD